MSNHITSPEPEREIPAKIRAEAESAGRDAVHTYLSTWQEEMRAYDRQNSAILAGEQLPAPAWLDDDPCPPWCVAEPHRASDHPDDRTHYASGTWVPLVTEEPVPMHPTGWAPPEIEVGMERRYREREPRVHLSDQEGKHAWHLTLDEAEKVAHAMLAHVHSARGGWRPAVLPFDEHGHCGNAECVACRAEGVEAKEASA
ncbi:DUF6907 domain-containing protein [Nonomuraea sp. CA-218870]|uniref:DUF6907 domain-containing protein n=1 Tax=Nonomuraea sp. CA-218870 TaxID=3239998 RepID=UPI003D8D20A2